MFGEGVGYTVTGYKARPLRLPSRLLHAAWSLIELGLQPRHSLAHAFDQAAIHDATGPVTDAPATVAKGTNLLKQRVLPEGAGSTGRARPSHKTRHKIFWNSNNNMKEPS
jgi:hypothetical protein